MHPASFPLRSVAAARAALRRRRDLQEALELARARGETFRVVGGAVRDAFLGRKGGDLDLGLSRGRALPFAEALGKRLGVKAIAMGSEGRRILRLVPAARSEIDIWEFDDAGFDRDRRDFTINALSFEFPSDAFDAPASGLDDLAAKRLVPPRAGVLLEDPLRVLRAARFEAELPGFRLVRSAFEEARHASRLLGSVAAERRLVELTRILEQPLASAVSAFRCLEAWGALEAMMPGTSSTERRRGIQMLARSPIGVGPEVARALLLRPLGEIRALGVLEDWRVSRWELRLAARLFEISLDRSNRAPSRREAVEWIRSAAPFVMESLQFLEAGGNAGARALARHMAPIVRRPAALSRILTPKRPISTHEVATTLGLSPGPALGRALERLDRALAAGEVRTRRQAEAFLTNR